MQARQDGGLAALRLLLRTTHLAGPDDLPALVQAAGEALGAVQAALYLVHYDQVQLVPLVEDGTGADQPRTVPIEGTLAGRSFSDVTSHTTTLDSGRACGPGRRRDRPPGRAVPPVRVERVLDEDLIRIGGDVAALLADLVTTRALYGDGVERARAGCRGRCRPSCSGACSRR